MEKKSCLMKKRATNEKKSYLISVNSTAVFCLPTYHATLPSFVEAVTLAQFWCRCSVLVPM